MSSDLATANDLGAALFAPRSIALVGASADADKASSRPLLLLERGGYTGTVYPVNARRDEIFGRPCWKSLSDLPEVPEQVLIMTPTAFVLETIEECGRLGVAVATILSGGFAEAGPDGAALELQVRDAARRTGLRLIGPNSLGIVDLANAMRLTGNGVFADGDFATGDTLVVSQSGSMIGSIASRGDAVGVGFKALVSVGAETDIGVGELCASTLNDPLVGSYLLFLEAIRQPDQLRDFALKAHAAGKPVVAFKLGRSSVGAEMAATHTGALASEDDVADEFLRDCGIARARTLGGMLASLDLVKQVPARQRGQRPRVGVVTTTGGGAALIVDELSLRGIDVVKASADTLKQLADTGAPAAPGPVIDVTLAGANPVVMSAVLDVLLKAPEFDVVMCVVGSSARLQPHLVVAPIIEIVAKGHLLPTFVVPEAPEAIAALRAAGVPAFATPEVCADAIATALTRIVPADRGIHIVDDHVATRHLDEVEGYAVLARAGIPSAAHQVVDLAELAAGAVDIQVAFPVVVKALAAELLHKSDVGAVVLNVDSMDGVRAAAAAIRKSVHEHRPDIDLTRVMVQTMTSDAAGSVLVSYRRDVHVGPMVLLSVGGTLTELWNCRSIRMAPVSRAEARDMIEEIPALRVLTGYRGAPPADVDALCAAIEGLSQFAHDLQVLSVEVNPVLVGRAGAGAWAVDAVVDVAAEHA